MSAPLDRAAVQAVLRELPGVWELDAGPATNDWHVGATRASDGLTLSVTRAAWNAPEGKVEVRLSGEGVSRNGAVRYDETIPSVNVSLTRPAATVARDLSRRLLPDAEAFWAVIRERNAASQAWESQVEANRERLGVRQVNGSDYIDLPPTSSAYVRDVRVNSDTVSFSLHYLTVDEALAVLAIVRGGAA